MLTCAGWNGGWSNCYQTAFYIPHRHKPADVQSFGEDVAAQMRFPVSAPTDEDAKAPSCSPLAAAASCEAAVRLLLFSARQTEASLSGTKAASRIWTDWRTIPKVRGCPPPKVTRSAGRLNNRYHLIPPLTGSVFGNYTRVL